VVSVSGARRIQYANLFRRNRPQIILIIVQSARGFKFDLPKCFNLLHRASLEIERAAGMERDQREIAEKNFSKMESSVFPG